MPRGDRTGPYGAGPRTGRALGYCSGYDAPGYVHPGAGFGRARGGGRMGRRIRGRGYGWHEPAVPYYGGYPGGYPAAYPAPPSAEEEMRYLQDDLEYLKREIKATEDRISQLNREPEE